jgi:hypothetical protein
VSGAQQCPSEPESTLSTFRRSRNEQCRRRDRRRIDRPGHRPAGQRRQARLLADLRQDNAEAAAKVLGDAGFEVSTAIVDVSSRPSVHALVKKATAAGEVTGLIHAAGVSPSQASPTVILKVDLYGTALVLEEFGNVIARGGAGVVIASQSGTASPR